mmetsp:Transcript_31747/g.47327  ORF Transcript_31747/g.47327 Transcript_31747/m.47327 type:complete len:99 (+) Transcript_31747:523-819(+)
MYKSKIEPKQLQLTPSTKLFTKLDVKIIKHTSTLTMMDITVNLRKKPKIFLIVQIEHRCWLSSSTNFGTVKYSRASCRTTNSILAFPKRPLLLMIALE